MPELPEVEVIRHGLAQAVNGARVEAVEVRDARALKRHRPLSGDAAGDFEARLTGLTLAEPARRGKFLWIPYGEHEALLAHLGMSGQLLLRTHDQSDDRHVRVRLWLHTPHHGELRLDFCDQRLFGSLAMDQLVPCADGLAAGWGTNSATIPGQAAHIARDPLDAAFDVSLVRTQFARRSVGVKQVLLDQQVVSGIGNIYADEALWLARIHPQTPAKQLSTRAVNRLMTAVTQVLEKALAEGGTSFDALYVNVNGESGYFAHSLNAYGRGGEPCPRCGTAIKRVPFAGRSSHFCPRCQRRR